MNPMNPVVCPACGRQVNLLDNAATATPPGGGSSYLGTMGKVLLYGGAAVALPCAAATALGFGAAGIVGGSIAAGLQGSTVAAGDLFATLQSLGATGTLVSGATVGGYATGAGMLASMTNYWRGGKGTSEPNKDTDKNDPNSQNDPDEEPPNDNETRPSVLCHACGHVFFLDGQHPNQAQ